MSQTANQSRERVILLTTPTTAPTSAVGSTATAPHLTLSPRTPSGELTTGFSLLLFAPDSGGGATAGAGGFDIVIYRLNPTLGIWGRCKTYSGAAYYDQLACYDLGGGNAIYITLGNVSVNGTVLALVGELSS